MRILGAVASKHGSTREIAEAVADELRATGVAADLREAGAVDDPGGYDAVILGSAIYMGNWLPEANEFATRHRELLVAVPMWLFGSGPLGAGDPQPHGDPADLAAVLAATGARGHVIFTGQLDQGELGLGERLIAGVVGALEGGLPRLGSDPRLGALDRRAAGRAPAVGRRGRTAANVASPVLMAADRGALGGVTLVATAPPEITASGDNRAVLY